MDQADTTGSSKNGGLIPSDFKFTTANETVTGLSGTLNNGDVLADGWTTDSDVLNATLTGGAALTSSLTNIENVNLDVKVAGSGLDMAGVTGAKVVSVNTNSGVAAVINSFDARSTSSPVVGLSGSGVLTVTANTLAGTTAGGTAESMSVKLSGATTTGSGATAQRAGITVNAAGAGVAGNLEVLNIESAGTAKNTAALALGANATGITKTVVSGAADLDLFVTSAIITGQTLTATDHTGALNLLIDRNGATTATTNLTNVSGVDTYTFRDTTAGTDSLVAANLVDNANVVVAAGFTGANSLTIKNAATSTTNVLNLTLDHETDATDVVIATGLSVADVETINFTSAGATSSGTNSVAAFSAPSASAININGASNFSLALAAVTYTEGKNLTITGSDATGKLVINGSLFSGTAGGVNETLTVFGGVNDDNITATANASAANVIDGGAGKDTVNIAGGAAASTITLGDGVDTLNLTDVAASTAHVTDFALGAGGDKISVNTAAAVTYGGHAAAAADNQLVVITAAVANDAAAKVLLNATSAEAAILVLNTSTGITELWYDADGNAGGEVKLASFDNITTIGALDGFVADNFGTWA